MHKRLAIVLLLVVLLSACSKAEPPPASAASSTPATNLRGTVTALELKDDFYGTPYYFLTVLAEDGATYQLVSNKMAYPFEFELEVAYAFYVRWGAARGDLVTYAEKLNE